jgi:hypothetical protein
LLAWHVKVNKWITINVKVKNWINKNLCCFRLNTWDLFSNKNNGIVSIKIMIPIIQTCLIESNPSHKHHSNVILNSYHLWVTWNVVQINRRWERTRQHILPNHCIISSIRLPKKHLHNFLISFWFVYFVESKDWLQTPCNVNITSLNETKKIHRCSKKERLLS